jgi:hypothetical protein
MSIAAKTKAAISRAIKKIKSKKPLSEKEDRAIRMKVGKAALKEHGLKLPRARPKKSAAKKPATSKKSAAKNTAEKKATIKALNAQIAGAEKEKKRLTAMGLSADEVNKMWASYEAEILRKIEEIKTKYREKKVAKLGDFGPNYGDGGKFSTVW